MANKIAPHGFTPLRYLNGAPWNGAVNMYYIPSTDGSMFSVGDPVKSAATGDANGIPGVQKAAGTDTVRGVVVACLAANPNDPSLVGSSLDLSLQNIPATKTKGYYVLVADDPKIVFSVQDDGASALTATSCNKNASFTVANPTSPAQTSQSVLGCATVNTTNSLNLKVIGLVQRADNAFGVNADWCVIFNMHELNGGTTAI